MSTWGDEEKVTEYLGRVDRLAARRAGEVELAEALPDGVTRALDLGCGDGRLLGLVLDARPAVTAAVGLDRSAPMLEHARGRFAEIRALLRPGGVFANLEVVACATPELHEKFNRLIGRPGGDPEDILAGVEEQLAWMRDAGLEHVDCNWRWRGFAVLVGTAPS